MLIIAFYLPMAISLIVGGFFLRLASRKNRIFLLEYLFLIVPICIWNILLMNRIGAQSLSNLIEVYLIAAVLIGYSVARNFIGHLQERTIGIALIGLTFLPVVLRVFTPVLPE